MALTLWIGVIAFTDPLRLPARPPLPAGCAGGRDGRARGRRRDRRPRRCGPRERACTPTRWRWGREAGGRARGPELRLGLRHRRAGRSSPPSSRATRRGWRCASAGPSGALPAGVRAVTTTAPPAGTRSRPRRRRAGTKRSRYWVAVGGCVLAVVAVVVLTVVLSENVVYFKTVSEAVKGRKARAPGGSGSPARSCPARSSRRPAGCGSRSPTASRRSRSCTTATRPSCSRRAPRSCARASWAAVTAGAPFDSDRIMIKHGSDYAPPKVDTKNAPKGERPS